MLCVATYDVSVSAYEMMSHLLAKNVCPIPRRAACIRVFEV